MASLSVRDAFIALETSDIVTLTHSMPGWDEILFRILSVGFDPNTWTIQLELLEEDVDLYDDAYNPSLLTWHTTNLPSPEGDYVPSVINASMSEELFDVRLLSGTRLVVDFDPPTDYPWWDGAEVWLKIGAGDWRFMTTSRDGYLIEGVAEGEVYSVKLVSRNIWGVNENFDNAATVSRTVVGYTTSAPGNLTTISASASGDVLNIIAAAIDNQNIIGYEIRMGDTWATSTFLAMLLDRPEGRIPSIRPGLQTIWAAAKNNANIYSSVPVSTTVFVPYPADFTYNDPQTWDYDAIGTHSNTEHTTHDFGAGATDALRCAHASGVLQGTWTSPTYTVSGGTPKFMRLDCEFDTDFVTGSQIWTSLFDEGTAWTATIPTGLTWQQIWNIYYAPYFNITLQYGTSVVTENSFADFANSYLEDDIAMWRIIITVRDPELTARIYVGPVTVNVRTYE